MAGAPGLIERLRRGLRRVDRREPGDVNHISLGRHCHMAQVLKRTGLRRWSGPFDWIFSSPGMVLDCLEDDFAALLDRSQYESTPLDARPAPDECNCRHRLFAQRHAIPFVFNHHDPATSEADYRFLAEGVRRLRAALRRPGTQNRFYLLDFQPPSEETALALSERLAGFGEGNRLVLLEGVLDPQAPGVEPLPSPRTNLMRLRLHTRSPSVGVRFADPADDALLADIVRAAAER